MADTHTSAVHMFRYNYTLVVNSTLYASVAPGLVKVDTDIVPYLNQGLKGAGVGLQTLNQTSTVVDGCPAEWRDKASALQAHCALVAARLWVQSPAATQYHLLEKLVLKKAQRFAAARSSTSQPTLNLDKNHTAPFNSNTSMMQIRYEAPIFVAAHWLLRFHGNKDAMRVMTQEEIVVLEKELTNDFGPTRMEPKGYKLDRVKVVLQTLYEPGATAATKQRRRQRERQQRRAARGLQTIPNTGNGVNTDVVDDLADRNQDLVQDPTNTGDTTTTGAVVNDVEMAVTARCTGSSCTSDNLATTLEEQGAEVTSTPPSDDDLLDGLQQAANEAGVADDVNPLFDVVDLLTSEDASGSAGVSLNITDVLDVTDNVPPAPNADDQPEEESTPGWIWVVVVSCVGSILLGVTWTLLAVKHRNREILLRREIKLPKRKRRPIRNAISSRRKMVSSRRTLATTERCDDEYPNGCYSSKPFDSTAEVGAEFLYVSDNIRGDDKTSQDAVAAQAETEDSRATVAETLSTTPSSVADEPEKDEFAEVPPPPNETTRMPAADEANSPVEATETERSVADEPEKTNDIAEGLPPPEETTPPESG